MVKLISYDGTNFANAGITIKCSQTQWQRTQQGVYVQSANSRPQFAGVAFDTFIFPSFVTFKLGSIESGIKTLDRILRWDKSTARLLVAQLDDGTTVQRMAVPRSLSDNNWVRHELLWESADYWTSSTATSASITGPASAGGTVARTITMAGTVRALPKVTLTPQLQKTSGTSVYTLTSTITEPDGYALHESHTPLRSTMRRRSVPASPPPAEPTFGYSSMVVRLIGIWTG